MVCLRDSVHFGSAILSRDYNISPWLSMVLAAGICGSFAYLIGVLILRLRGNYLAMATLGLGIILCIIFGEAAKITDGPAELPGAPYLSIGKLVFNNDRKYFYLTWFFCLAIPLISRNIVNIRIGRALCAIRDSEAAAASAGIRLSRLKVKGFYPKCRICITGRKSPCSLPDICRPATVWLPFLNPFSADGGSRRSGQYLGSYFRYRGGHSHWRCPARI